MYAAVLLIAGWFSYISFVASTPHSSIILHGFIFTMTSLTGAPVQHLKPAADTNAPPNGTQISTILAARLQSRISNDNVTKSRADRESLQQLLHILLNDERETQLDQETPLDETHRLIWVIAEAGLQGADDGSTSALEATLQTQALDTLEVIRVVVQRRPQLLFNVSNWAQQSRGISSVPLFVWLLPKIISASAIWSKSSVVCEKAFEVVSAVVKSRPKCLQPSQECFTTANFLLGILAGQFPRCERFDFISDMTQISLPSWIHGLHHLKLSQDNCA